MTKVLRSAQAAQDLDDIWFYIAQDSVSAADRWIEALLETTVTLAFQPDIGRLRPELAPEIRSMPVKAYMIYYRPISDGIEIIRVLHASRNTDSTALDDSV